MEATITLTESQMKRIYSSLRVALDWCYVNRSEETKAEAARDTDEIIRKLHAARLQLNSQKEAGTGSKDTTATEIVKG